MKCIISCFCLLAAFLTSYGQDKILFLNGKQLEVSTVIGIQDKSLIYQPLRDTSRKSFLVSRVFSVTGKTGQERVLYKQDTLQEYYLTPEQMRMFITGEQEAMRTYRSPGAFAAGTAFGVTGGLLIPFFASVSVLPPSIGILAINYPTPYVSANKVSDKAYLGNPDFVAGYQQKARSKRLRSACLGAATGLLSTFAVLFITGSFK